MIDIFRLDLVPIEIQTIIVKLSNFRYKFRISKGFENIYKEVIENSDFLHVINVVNNSVIYSIPTLERRRIFDSLLKINKCITQITCKFSISRLIDDMFLLRAHMVDITNDLKNDTNSNYVDVVVLMDIYGKNIEIIEIIDLYHMVENKATRSYSPEAKDEFDERYELCRTRFMIESILKNYIRDVGNFKKYFIL